MASGNPLLDSLLKKGGTKAVAYAVPGAGEALAAKNAAQTAAKPISWVIGACALSCFVIFIGTLAGWIQQNSLGSKADQTKKQNLHNSWIAFLVLFLSCFIIWFMVHKAATYKIAGIF
jgi:magnesium-transporting ATPase (P-type)